MQHGGDNQHRIEYSRASCFVIQDNMTQRLGADQYVVSAPGYISGEADNMTADIQAFSSKLTSCRPDVVWESLVVEADELEIGCVSGQGLADRLVAHMVATDDPDAFERLVGMLQTPRSDRQFDFFNHVAKILMSKSRYGRLR
jgi:hypothetical protein